MNYSIVRNGRDYDVVRNSRVVFTGHFAAANSFVMKRAPNANVDNRRAPDNALADLIRNAMK